MFWLEAGGELNDSALEQSITKSAVEFLQENKHWLILEKSHLES